MEVLAKIFTLASFTTNDHALCFLLSTFHCLTSTFGITTIVKLNKLKVEIKPVDTQKVM